ncbi:MAG TPA: AI-2E family transporter [Bacteroidia bacterium]|nr:AI-2E family transporter [Bacteroidia bacterium]
MDKLKKPTLILFFILLVIGFLVISRPFLVPFLYGLLIAMIMYPVCKWFENKKIPRGAAVIFSVSLVLLFFLGIVSLLILQLNSLNKDLPQLLKDANVEFARFQNWLTENVGVSLTEQNTFFNDFRKGMSGNITGLISGTAVGLFNIIIIPVYACLILYYRNVIVDFIVSITGKKYTEELAVILNEAIVTYFHYIRGMFFVYLTVGILNSIGLFLLGVKYPLLFGMLTAFMTIIPYLGIIISSLLPISITWMETKSIYIPLGIVGVFAFVQYLEAYFIFPYIVGKQLNINMLASIVLIIIGGFIWGVSGLLLFLPYIALLKIVSGKIEGLEPFRVLLEIPPGRK